MTVVCVCVCAQVCTNDNCAGREIINKHDPEMWDSQSFGLTGSEVKPALSARLWVNCLGNRLRFLKSIYGENTYCD